jgi:hypothetical protein
VSATFTSSLRTWFSKLYGQNYDTNGLMKIIIDRKTHANLSNLHHEFIQLKGKFYYIIMKLKSFYINF